MRIISGKYKYRKIEVPKSARPTSEKVKEALFSILYDRVLDSTVLDLFAGSGALGLEALSRGAKQCIFNESDRASYRLLQDNINKCGAMADSIVYNYDFRRLISEINNPCDIIFLDPPYNKHLYCEILDLLLESKVLHQGTIVCLEHSYDESINYPDDFELLCAKRYGTIGLDIISKR